MSVTTSMTQERFNEKMDDMDAANPIPLLKALVTYLERQRANLLRRQGETFDQIAVRRRARIYAAHARGETPPRDPAPGCGGYFDPLWLDADDDSPLPAAGAAPAPPAHAQQQAGIEPKCKTCGGAGIVDDGEIDHYPNGEPYMHGPVKCVKDCPDCPAPVPPTQDQQHVGALTDDQIKKIFLANGFTIKEGNGDLKPYVYAAAHALLAAGGAQ